MNRRELAKTVAADTAMDTATVDTVIRATLDTIARAVVGGETVSLTNFGTFIPRESAGHLAWNPTTRQRISVPTHNRVQFRTNKQFRAYLRDELEMPEAGPVIYREKTPRAS